MAGLEFLFPIRAVGYAGPHIQAPDVAGKTVAVIGAGHSAVDVAHSAVFLGAAKVHLLYRRTRNEAPCGSYEIAGWWRWASPGTNPSPPCVFWAMSGSRGWRCPKKLGSRVRTGRWRLPGDGIVTVIEADLAVTAVGETATPPFARAGAGERAQGEVLWLHMTDIENGS
jgi:glutamate synthase (NADPH/NADH) small chain